ncbi:MAG: amidase [Thermoleophilia bacterium]
MSDLRAIDATEIARRVGAGEVSALEVVEAHLAAAAEADVLNAVVTWTGERALARARARVTGPLAGVPLLVKDLFDTAGVRTAYGSSIFRDHVPDRTAEAVVRLEQAGAITIGKANLHEFAWGTTSQNPHWGDVGNPVRPGRTPGGSSGGNAAALAAGVSALGLGTDTGGSVRMPAACCGVVGFKPGHGVVPIGGCFPLSPTFDHVGPLARSARDCALAYAVLARRPLATARAAGLRVGLLDEGPRISAHEPSGAASAAAGGVDSAWADDVVARLEALGARVAPVSLPEPDASVVPIFLHESAVTHRRLFPARRDEYGPDTRLKFDAARAVPAIDVHEARLALPAWRARCARELEVDLLVSPTLGIEPPPADVWEPDVRVEMTMRTRPFNQLGWPAIALGDLQLAGLDDLTVLGLALAWEEAYGPPGRPA